VISNVAADAGEITGLVHIAGFAPAPGESAFTLAARFGESTLGDALRAQDLFHHQFAPAPQAARMAATQRPVTDEALQEPAGERPLWRELPSWFMFGDEDRNIPAASSASWPTAPAPARRSACGTLRTRCPSPIRGDGSPDLEVAALPVAA
jgi:hypothetical protein